MTHADCSFQQRTDVFAQFELLPSAPELLVYLHEPGLEMLFHYFYLLYEITSLTFGEDTSHTMDLQVQKEIHQDSFAVCKEDKSLDDFLGIVVFN